MPASKKKKAAGPQRGFATVSIQKKVVPVEEPAEEPEAAAPDGAQAGESAKAEQTVSSAAPAEVEEPEIDPEELELQRLTDSIKAGCDKETSRLVKVIEYDQRMSKSLPVFLWKDSALKEDILRLARQEDDHIQPVPLSLDQETKLLSKLVSHYAVLERLGISKERIIECFQSVKHIELEDIMDWLALHCSDSELEFAGPQKLEPESHVFVDTAVSSRRPSVDSSADNSDAKSSSSATTPASIEAALPNVEETKQPDETPKPPAAVLPSKAFDESLEQDPTGAWVAAKLELLSLSRQPDTTLNGQKRALEKRIADASERYQFDEKQAEAAFKAGRAKIDADALRERLSQPVEPKVKKEKAKEGNGTDTPADDEPMFGTLLEEPLVVEHTADGKIVEVLDLSLPKKGTARPPKNLLLETLKRVDPFAVASYRVISTGRAVRSAVLVRWGSGRVDEFGMSDVACQDQVQAENYVSTMALFHIATTPVHRQLPATFKDLWDQLSAKRDVDTGKAYQQHVKELKDLAATRLTDTYEDRKTPSKPQIIESWAEEEEDVAQIPRQFDLPEPSFQLHQAFAARAASPAYQEMLQYRATLPIAAYRQTIVEAVTRNQVIILCGETGCGKSTQLPAFLLEQWLSQGRQANILVTEPRRISAISLAQRVSKELGDAPGTCGTRGSLVGYNVRLEARTSPTTRLVYATTGIALRMLEGDTALEGLTHLIIDEVHERSIDSDFLMITLKELLQRRTDLRLVLMSATVDSDKLSEYWSSCPVISVPGRTFPVSPFFLEDVVELCGYRLDESSDSQYVRRTRPGQRPRQVALDDDLVIDSDEDAGLASEDLGKRYSKQTKTTLENIDEHQINYELIVALIEMLCFRRAELVPYSNAILIFLPSLESIRKLNDMLEAHEILGGPAFQIFPLHSTISNERQSLVFGAMPHGVRKIVIATNIAETGITIPDITCVIDSGRHREMLFDEKRQISRLVETFIARSNAAQRRGRAGRVQEGLAFAMFTKHRHDTQFVDHPQPEMLRLSLQDLALRIKILQFKGSIAEVLLRALDPPALNNIERAIAALVEVKALTQSEEITTLGRHLAKLPVDVHLGKLLLLGCLFNCLDAALTIVAALNAKSPWLTPFGREAEADAAKRSFKIENSDFLTLHKAFSSWRVACRNGVHLQFTHKAFLSPQTLQQVEEFRVQFFNLLVEAGFVDPAGYMFIPSKARVRFLQVPDALDVNSADPRLVMACVGCAMFPKVLVANDGGGWKTLITSTPASVHPSSVNFAQGRRPDFGPSCKYIAYANILQSKKLYVWENGPVEEQAVMAICGGDADYKIASHTVTIDRNRVRVRVDARSALALKRLRAKYAECMAAKLKGKEWTSAQAEWWSFVCRAVASQDKEKRAHDAQREAKPSTAIKVVRHI